MWLWRDVVRHMRLLPALLTFAFTLSALADQITLHNGDRLSGTILKFDEKNVVIKTDYAGVVTVKFEAVHGITSTEDLHVKLNDVNTHVGPVKTSDRKFEVATKIGGLVEL